MGTKKETMDYIMSRIESVGEVSCKRMFGEYGVYYQDRMFALVCDDQLFIKPTVAGKDFLGEVEEGQPYPGAKEWFLITEDRWDDEEWLCELIRRTYPEVTPVKKKTKTAKN